MKLPVEFLNKMKTLLGESEYNDFLESYNKPRYYGLRVNTLKVSVEGFKGISPFKLEPIPWTKDGFYYPDGENPGRHPYYYAGLYYIQEPSAMLPGAVADAMPGEYVLDLCAAPGGKTVQMAAGMKGQGVLIANDINADRVKALVKNIELSGIRNAIVTNETPEKLAVKFEMFFDKILIDAPCSGEGMFRKDEEAIRSWEKYKCEKCEGMQWSILQNVDRMLKPGGYIVYSTCTFSPEENEIMISRFINGFKGYELVDIIKSDGIENGRPEWADGCEGLEKTARLWPHKVKGEGHFTALLKKQGCEKDAIRRIDFKDVSYPINKRDNKLKAVLTKDDAVELFKSFVGNNLNIDITGEYELKGSNLYCLPIQFPDLSGLKVAKFGWYLGEVSNGKFEPSHSLAIALGKNDFKKTLDLKSDSREVISYLKGETLMRESEKGLIAVCVDGYVLGWAKSTGDIIKNLYPKGWRKMA